MCDFLLEGVGLMLQEMHENGVGLSTKIIQTGTQCSIGLYTYKVKMTRLVPKNSLICHNYSFLPKQQINSPSSVMFPVPVAFQYTLLTVQVYIPKLSSPASLMVRLD